MTRFFRRIRQELAAQNRVAKYLRYAVGEIVLVVIGILFALQINIRNEGRKIRITEQKYLVNIIEDLKADSIDHVEGWEIRVKAKFTGLNVAKEYYFGNYNITDTAGFISSVSKGAIGGIGPARSNDPTYRDMVNTGKLSFIRNDAIRYQIQDYYNEKEWVISYVENLRTDYGKYINGLRPFDPDFPGQLDSRDILFFLKQIRNEDFIRLINQEITYGKSANQRYIILHRKGLQLSHSIQNYLQNK